MRCFMSCLFLFFFLLSFVPGTGVDGVGDDIIIMLYNVLCLILENKVNGA